MQIITNQFQKELKKHGSDHFPFLVSYEKLSGYEQGYFMWHWHPEIEITLVRQGTMCYKVNDQCFHLKTGDLLFDNSNVLHAGSMEQKEDCDYVSVTFDPKLIYGFFQSTICTRYVEPVTQDFSLPAIHIDGSADWHGRFAELMREVIALDKERPEYYELDITIRLQMLWKLLLEHRRPGEGIASHNATEYERIKKIISYIDQNYQERITLKDIADHIHLCESECTRLFRRYMNVTLFSFLQEYRIERSLEYLNGGETISDIAGKVGFADPNYYSKVFAKIKGCSPREYRKRL